MCYYVISEKELRNNAPSACQGSAGSVKCNVLYIVVLVASKWTECVVTEEINPEDSRDDLTDPGRVRKKQVIRKWNMASRFWGCVTAALMSDGQKLCPESLFSPRHWHKLYSSTGTDESNSDARYYIIQRLLWSLHSKKSKRCSIPCNLNIIRLLTNTITRDMQFCLSIFGRTLSVFEWKTGQNQRRLLVLLYSPSDYAN